MPKCKNCGTRLSIANKDICPVCGNKNPFNDAISEQTIDFTSTIDPKNNEFLKYKQKDRRIFLLLSIFLGYFSLQYLYLKSFKKAICLMTIHACLIILCGTLLFFFSPLNFYSFILCVSLSTILNIAIGLYVFFNKDYKDGRQEFLK